MPTIRFSYLVFALWASCLTKGWGAPLTVSFPHPTYDSVITDYTQQGFEFSAARIEYTADYRGPSPATAGTLRIMGSTGSDVLRINQTSNSVFNLSQIDLQTTAYYASGTALVTGTETFTGFLRGGATVQQTFDINQNWQTFAFPDTFKNLLYVTAPLNVFGGFNINNVVLEPLAVPEPSTWAMLVTGGGIFGLVLHRQSRAPDLIMQRRKVRVGQRHFLAG